MRRILTLLSLAAVFATIPIFASTARAEDPCIECHTTETPGIVEYWRQSAHRTNDVLCADCHGTDVDANHSRSVTVDAGKCGSCHEKAYNQQLLGKHSIGLKSGRACTRNISSSQDAGRSCSFCHEAGSTEPIVKVECGMFLAQTPEMQRRGCDSCHRVEASCDSCHTRHGTDKALAGKPETCGVCHMGPDHPQYEMWESSMHGVIYKEKGEAAAPSCVTCHMPEGSHDISTGIATGLPADDELWQIERSAMLRICKNCHTERLAKSNLDDGDRIEAQSRKLVEEAQGIVEALNREGLLRPSPKERPAHPLFGQEFVIGGHMLYENLSSVESTFFRMKQFYYLITFKGVFHQNPDYAHWFGNAPLKLSLSEIKSEAAMLRELDRIGKRVDNMAPLVEMKGRDAATGDETDTLKIKIRELNELKLKGEITEEEYNKRKKELLDSSGL